jgi:hypothetical protein
MIHGNTIQQATGSTTNSGVLIIANSTGTNAIRAVSVSDNIIESGSINIRGDDTAIANNVLVSNNNLINTSGSAIIYGIYVERLTNSTIIGNTIDTYTRGIATNTCTYMNIVSNFISNTDRGISNNGSTTYTAYVNNKFFTCVNDHTDIDYTTCSTGYTKNTCFSIGSLNNPDTAMFSIVNNAGNPTEAVKISNASTLHGIELVNSGVLASNKNGLFVWSDGAQTTGNGLGRFRLGSTSSTIPAITIEHLGTDANAKGISITMSAVTQSAISTNGKLTAGSVSCSPTISTGTSAPTTTPSKVGDVFIDTSAIKIYFATGTSSSTDWTITN